MKNYTSETIDISSFKNIPLQASFYRPRKKEIQATILYFHGGGIIFGARDDLPEKYIELFADHGLALFAVDYPLAPETKMPEILEVIFDLTDYFVQDFLADLGQKDYFIMGRSAGGFLALSTALYTQNLDRQAHGLISLYGYYNLNDPDFTTINPYYQKYPPVSDRLVSSLIKKGQIVTKGDHNRFLLYLASRQRGDWMDLLVESAEQKQKYSLSPEEIKSLPPLFLAASKADPDVPSRQSRQLANFHPNAELIIHELDEHDFDRTQVEEYGLPTYQKMIDWIFKQF